MNRIKRLISIFVVVLLSLLIVSVTSFAAEDNDSQTDASDIEAYAGSETDERADDNVNEHVEHDFGEWNTLIEPTCTESGEAERYCVVCKCRESKYIPAKDHDWTNWSSWSPTQCNNEGFDFRQCMRCDEVEYRSLGYGPHLFYDGWVVNYIGPYGKGISAFRDCVYCGYHEDIFAPGGAVTIRNTIANSAKRTNDVIWSYDEATKYQMAYRPRNGTWLFKNVRNERGQMTGLKIGSLYEIKVRPYIDLPESSEKLFGDWSEIIYRYFHTTQKIRLTSKSKGTFTMSWAKNPNATGYQILYTTNKNGSGAAQNIVNIGANATSVTRSTIKLNGKTQTLKSGVTYYVQVREIKRVGSINYIGNISCPVAVKVK